MGLDDALGWAGFRFFPGLECSRPSTVMATPDTLNRVDRETAGFGLLPGGGALRTDRLYFYASPAAEVDLELVEGLHNGILGGLG